MHPQRVPVRVYKEQPPPSATRTSTDRHKTNHDPTSRATYAYTRTRTQASRQPESSRTTRRNKPWLCIEQLRSCSTVESRVQDGPTNPIQADSLDRRRRTVATSSTGCDIRPVRCGLDQGRLELAYMRTGTAAVDRQAGDQRTS